MSTYHIPATRRMHVGKEFEQFESLRFYDPLLVRFTTPDPLALSFPSLSPYAYCANNPVCNVDLDGRKAIRITLDLQRQTETEIEMVNLQ